MYVWFTDQSIAGTSWWWDFDDGTGSAERSPYHVFNEPGLYEVTQNVVGPGGSDVTSSFITVCAPGAPCTYWIGAGGGNFEQPDNWSNDVPCQESTAIFDLHTDGYTVLFNGDVTNNSLFVGADTETFDLNGWIYTLPFWPAADVACNNGDFATLNLVNGGGLLTASISIGTFDHAVGEVNVAGSGTLLDANGMVVGEAFGAQGTLTITDGASVGVGHEPDAAFHIGWGGHGGGGGTEPADGSVIVRGAGSSLTLDYWCDVGVDGIATLRIENGGLFTAINCGIAKGTGSIGSVTVTGTGSRMSIAADHNLYVGYHGQGTLLIERGGLVSNLAIEYPGIVGNCIGSVGELTVTRSGSTYDGAGQLQVGRDGSGTLLIADGGYVVTTKEGSPTNSSGVVGGDASSSGSVLVTDAGSLWEQDGGLSIGFYGQGTLGIEAGGAISSTDGFIARCVGAAGTAVITGTDSAWTVTESFYIGGDETSNGGTADVNVAAGGSLVIADTLRLWNQGALTLDGGSVTVGSGPAETTPDRTRVYPDGTLAGQGALTGNVVSDGALAPGSPTGILTILGGYTQGTFGVLSIDIGGTTPGSEFDLLGVAGMANLDGELHIELIDDYVPEVGQEFTILAAGSVTGEFLTVTGQGNFAVTYDADGVTLTALPPGDLNGDGCVDHADLGILLADWMCDSGDCAGDCDGDGDTDHADLGILLAYWGEGCG